MKPKVGSTTLDTAIVCALLGATTKTVYAWTDRKKRQHPLAAIVPADGVSFPYREELVRGDYATYVNEAGEKLSYRTCFAAPVSTRLEAAWHVVEKMREVAPPTHANLSLRAYCYNRTYATFCPDGFSSDDSEWSEGNGEHATPLAICFAALKVLGVEVPS